MADGYVLEPDLAFIKKIKALGAGDLKKCFQCATCSVACPISPDTKPFPRKEMIAASWGLKDRLVANHDIWLCHNCGDCTTLCPRGARPGDLLAAVRAYAVSAYAKPKVLADMVQDPKKLPILAAIPIVIFLVVGLITGLLDFTPGGDRVVHGNFVSTWLVDIVMIPTFLFAAVVFALGLKDFLNDVHQTALREGKTDKEKLDIAGVVKGVVAVIPTILKHDKFTQCTENRERSTAHLMVLYSFIGLFIVTNCFFIAMYVLGYHGPYSQLNPIKWLGNISGVALIIGSGLLIKSRWSKKDQVSNYVDWYLLWIVFGLGVTGMGAQLTRLADLAFISYFTYAVHLVLIFMLFAFTPYSKLAHLVYRTTAMGYNEWAGRK